MGLIVESGTGATNSNSFVSLEYCNVYHSDRGNTAWTALGNAAKEGAIIRAGDYINSLNFSGIRSVANQAMAFPRTGLIDSDGYELATDAIPREVKMAQCEAAIREGVSAGTLNPDLDNSEARIKRKKIDVLETEWFDNGPNDKTRFTAIEGMLRPMLSSLMVKTIHRS